ncbi:MAG TPA: hypothetical protein VLA12_14110 [Planctomycetaceae bacterium]|nr:hypothetical protein [Planctomycetaceae bacterium]
MSQQLIRSWILRTSRLLLPTMALGICSCTSTSWNKPSVEQAGTSRVELIPTQAEETRPPRVDLARGGIRQISAEEYEPVSTRPYDASPVSATAVVVSRSEPRVPLNEASTMVYVPPPMGVPQPDHNELAKLYPDEYLFDGGDRGLPYHYENNAPAGFESEDTLAEFEDHTGEHRVKPTTRVAIYSPRFAAVSTLTEPHENAHALAPAAADKTVVTQRLESQRTTTFHNEYNAPGGVLVRSRASGLEVEAETHGFEQSTNLALNDGLFKVIQNLQFFQSGRLNKADAAVVGEYIKNASLWTRNESPTISASDSAGMQVKATFKAMEIVGIEDSRKRRGDLQIVKLADRKVAAPGDVITFSLRYDNLGDFELKNLRIVDNLTPRLEFVEGSESFEGLAGTLQTFDNNEGSLILQFKLEGELDGHQGGTITFQTRVR